MDRWKKWPQAIKNKREELKEVEKALMPNDRYCRMVAQSVYRDVQ